MFNPVQQLIVGKASGVISTAITTLTTDYATVVAGDVYVVNSALKVIAAAADITPVIYIAQGTAPGKYKLSAPITTGNITSIKSEAYVAQAQKVVCAGNIGSGALDLTTTNGSTYKFSILFKDDQRFMPQRQTRRDFVLTAVYAATVPTAAESLAFATSFVTLINADAFLSTLIVAAVNVTAGAVGIKITGLAQTFSALNNRQEYVDFTTSFYDITSSSSTYQATTTVTAPFVIGNGTASQCIALENKLMTWDGRTNRSQFPVINNTSFISASTNYDLINITHFAVTPGQLEGRDSKPFQVILAMATASAQAAAIIVTLELLNNSAAGVIANATAFTDGDV